jgi:hypothetical protein
VAATLFVDANRLGYGSHPEEEGPMKRMVTALFVATGIAVVVGSGVWAVNSLTRPANHTATEVVVNPQMAAIPGGGISTGDGSTGR